MKWYRIQKFLTSFTQEQFVLVTQHFKNPIRDCSRSNHMPQTDQITEIAPHVRPYF